MMVLNEDQLGEFIDTHFTDDLFRLEKLENYELGSDGGDFRRYLQGEARPTAEGRGAWLERLRGEEAAGRHSRRVHVVKPPLGEYLRYECEWGYVYNAAAGEEIRIFDLGAADWPRDLRETPDFFLIDDRYALLMDYDERGRFVGATVGTDQQLASCRRIRDLVWQAATPFEEWWKAHPEYHRHNPAPAV
jgi:hypothetical protein